MYFIKFYKFQLHALFTWKNLNTYNKTLLDWIGMKHDIDDSVIILLLDKTVGMGKKIEGANKNDTSSVAIVEFAEKFFDAIKDSIDPLDNCKPLRRWKEEKMPIFICPECCRVYCQEVISEWLPSINQNYMCICKKFDFSKILK